MGYIQHQTQPLYRRRTFSDKFSDTSDFITANWRVLLKMLTITILPVSAIQALNLNGLMSNVYGSVNDGAGSAASIITGLAINYGSLMVFGLIATVLFISIVYAVMRLYHATGNDGTPPHPELGSMTFAQFRPYMMRQMRPAWKSIGAMVLIGIMMLAIMVLGGAGLAASSSKSNIEDGVFAIMMLAAYACIFLLMPPAMMAIPVYSFEKTGFWAGLKKGIVYGFKTWRGVVAVMFVFGIIIGFVGGFLSLPWMILNMLKAYFVADGSTSLAFVNTIWYNFITYLFGILYIYVSYIGYAAMLVALAYQYGHAHEVIDGEDF